VQVSAGRLHVQPGPLIEVAVRLAGSVSTTVTTPLVGPVPTLDAVIVYDAPICPRKRFPTWVFVTVRSAWSMVVGSLAEWLPVLTSFPEMLTLLTTVVGAAAAALTTS